MERQNQLKRSCEKQHPRPFKYYSRTGHCKFEKFCKYKHGDIEQMPQIQNNDPKDMEIEKLKEKINKMSDKIKHL